MPETSGEPLRSFPTSRSTRSRWSQWRRSCRGWARGLEVSRLRPASWLLILALGSAASLALPGATIFFLVAPALALIGIALAERTPRLAVILGILAILIQFLMFAELLALVEMLLIDGPLWAVAPLAALAALPALIEIEARALRPAIGCAGPCCRSAQPRRAHHGPRKRRASPRASASNISGTWPTTRRCGRSRTRKPRFPRLCPAAGPDRSPLTPPDIAGSLPRRRSRADGPSNGDRH